MARRDWFVSAWNIHQSRPGYSTSHIVNSRRIPENFERLGEWACGYGDWLARDGMPARGLAIWHIHYQSRLALQCVVIDDTWICKCGLEVPAAALLLFATSGLGELD